MTSTSELAPWLAETAGSVGALASQMEHWLRTLAETRRWVLDRAAAVKALRSEDASKMMRMQTEKATLEQKVAEGAAQLSAASRRRRPP